MLTSGVLKTNQLHGPSNSGFDSHFYNAGSWLIPQMPWSWFQLIIGQQQSKVKGHASILLPASIFSNMFISFSQQLYTSGEEDKILVLGKLSTTKTSLEVFRRGKVKSPGHTLSRSRATGRVSSSLFRVEFTRRHPGWFTWKVPVFPKKGVARDPCKRSELKFDFVLVGASSLKHILASILHKTLRVDSCACSPLCLLSILRSLSKVALKTICGGPRGSARCLLPWWRCFHYLYSPLFGKAG